MSCFPWSLTLPSLHLKKVSPSPLFTDWFGSKYLHQSIKLEILSLIQTFSMHAPTSHFLFSLGNSLRLHAFSQFTRPGQVLRASQLFSLEQCPKMLIYKLSHNSAAICKGLHSASMEAWARKPPRWWGRGWSAQTIGGACGPIRWTVGKVSPVACEWASWWSLWSI